MFPAHEWKRTAREAVQFFYSLPAGVAFREKNQYYEDLWSELVRHEGASISDFSFGTHDVSGQDWKVCIDNPYGAEVLGTKDA